MKILKFCIFGLLITVGAAYAEEPSDAVKRKSVTSQYYVDEKLKTKQPIVNAQSGNYIVTYPTGGAANNGVIGQRHIANVLSGNANDGTGAVGNNDIPTVGAVNTGLNAKQAKLSNTAGRLVTYGGTGAAAGTVGAADVYNETYTYASQTDSLVRAAQVNAAVANAFGGILTCSGWDDGYNSTNDPNGDHCLYYTVDTNMGSGTYVPQGNTAAPNSGN